MCFLPQKSWVRQLCLAGLQEDSSLPVISDRRPKAQKKPKKETFAQASETFGSTPIVPMICVNI